jgi:hypothetical protein
MSHTYQLPIQAIKPDYLSKILQETKWFNECDFCLKHQGYTFELSIKNKNASNNTIQKYNSEKIENKNSIKIKNNLNNMIKKINNNNLIEQLKKINNTIDKIQLETSNNGSNQESEYDDMPELEDVSEDDNDDELDKLLESLH